MGDESMSRLREKEQDMCILVNDPTAADMELFSEFAHTHYLPNFKDWDIGHAKDVFVISSAVGLVDVADVIHRANDAHRLRAILIREEINQNWVPRMLANAQLRTLRNLLVHSGWEVPQRVLTAWKFGAQEKLIADAAVFGDQLFVQDCALNTFQLSFDSSKALSKIPVAERGRFSISKEGSHISWPAVDIDLDLDSIRVILDPAEAAKAKARRMNHNQWFGAAIASYRKRNNLTQRDIIGLSDRQVRRIEGGDHASIKSLEALASAHGLSLGEYLNEISKEAQQIKSGSIN